MSDVVRSIEHYAITDRATWLKRREPDVTASVAAALFGAHPYMTAYKLWAIKSGLISDDDSDSPAKRRGRLLEPVAIEMLREERPDWSITPGRHYYRDGVQRIGATPDVLATRPDIQGTGIVQIKTVGHFAFRKGWRDADTGDVEIPLWIAVQASVEAALIAATWACVAAMALGDGGLEMFIVEVPLKPLLVIRLRALVADFWRRVREHDPYPPDFGKDAATIARLYAQDDGGEIDLSGNKRAAELVAEHERLAAIEALARAANKERKPIDAELISLLGNAARGKLGDGRAVEANTVKRAGYVVKATSYRAVKVKELV